MSDPIDQLVGLRIRTRRVQMHLSQEAVADALGISFQQLQKYESGRNRIAASRIYALGKILAVEPTYFFAVELAQEGPALVDPVEIAIQSKEGRRLNEAFQRIKSGTLRRSIVSLVENIAGEADPAREHAGQPTKTVSARTPSSSDGGGVE